MVQVRDVDAAQTAGRIPPLTVADHLGVALGEAGRAIIRPTPKLPAGSNLLTWREHRQVGGVSGLEDPAHDPGDRHLQQQHALDKIVEAVLP